PRSDQDVLAHPIEHVRPPSPRPAWSLRSAVRSHNAVSPNPLLECCRHVTMGGCSAGVHSRQMPEEVCRVSVLPGAEPFQFQPETLARPVGVVLCHGFTGCPQSLRPWGEYLRDAGFAVDCPLLPGHGTRWQDMNATRW